MPKLNFDAVIIGGGIIGVSTAYHLARRGLKRVAILEKGAQVAAGSTGQSSAVVRQKYANIELIQLANYSLRMFQNWSERLELKRDRCGFQQVGVVWIPDGTHEDHHATLRQFERVGALGHACSADELRGEYPSLNLCSRSVFDVRGNSLDGASHECIDPTSIFWEPDAGCADPQGTTEDLLEAGRTAGVSLFLRHEVKRIEPAVARGFDSVECANGATFSCDLLLNAAGPWCNRINGLVGATTPMNLRPTRVQMSARERPAEIVGKIPVFVSAADKIYGRPEIGGRGFLVGSVAPEDESEEVDDPDHFDTTASVAFRDRMMHGLHHLFPMKSRGAVRGYAGLYTVNTDDWHPVIDTAGPEGFFVANGFSGHGFKLGPSIGALIARLMSGVERSDDPPVDVRYFAADRKPIHSGGGVLA